jgi:hypothetical protein
MHCISRSWTRMLYIKSCSHEVAKHKLGVICRFHLTVPPLATTLRKMVTQSVRMGNAHAYDRTIFVTGWSFGPVLRGPLSPPGGTSRSWSRDLGDSSNVAIGKAANRTLYCQIDSGCLVGSGATIRNPGEGDTYYLAYRTIF